MATLREILSFVITADAGQAIREFDKLEKSSTKSLGAVGDPTLLGKSAAQWTKIGAAAGGFALIAGAGIYKAASAAGDLEKSMSRIEATFGKSSDSVKEFARNARFLSDRSAAQYAADIGEAAQGLGLAADESAKLVPNVVDVASKLAIIKGLDMGTALESISAALRGEYDATQRLVPALSAARIQEEALQQTGKQRKEDLTTAEKAYAALNIIIKDGTKIVEGNTDALNSQSAKMAETKARLDDAMVAFGAGALPAVEGFTGVIKTLAEGMAKLPKPITETAGALGAIVVGLSAIGSIGAFAMGGLTKLGTGFTALTAKMVTAEGQLTTLGIAMKGLSAVGAIAGLVYLGHQLDEATENTTDFETALNKLKVSSSEKAIGRNLKRMADDTQSLGDKFVLLGMSIQTLEIGDSAINVQALQEALDKLKDTDPEELARVLPVVAAALDDMGPKDKETKRLEQHVKDLQEWSDSAKDVKAAEEGKAAATDKGTAAAEKSTEATKAQQEANKALGKALKDTSTAIESAAGMMDVFAEGGKAATQWLDLSDRMDDTAASAAEMGTAMQGAGDIFKNLPDHIDLTKLALGKYSEEQTKAISGIDDLATSTQEFVGSLVAANTDIPTTMAKVAALRDEFTKQMKAAGMTTAQIEEYQHVLGLTDEQVITAIKLAGDAEAKAKLTAIQGQLEVLDEGVQVEIAQKILAGDWQGAAATAQQGMQDYANKHPVKQPVVGVRVPTRDPDARLGNPGGLAAGAQQNVTVYMPAGSNGRDVLSTLRRHAARNGALV